MANKFFGRGKLLLTGEYGVLDGAKGLSLPCKLGQRLIISNQRSSDLSWKSMDKDGNCWFEAKISFFDFSVSKTTDEDKAAYLAKLLQGAVRLNSDFLSKWNGFKVKTELDFPLDWGLGSSSTLTHLVAQWADVNPLLLHFKISDGSGYDVASAGADLPILYQMVDDTINYKEIDFEPDFLNKMYFVHLNKKQSTSIGIRHYLKEAKGRKQLAKDLTQITDQVSECNDFDTFNSLLNKHEQLVAKSLSLTPVKQELFKDYWGTVKSLGAWGGDFVLATSDKGEVETQAYFNSKGYDTVLGFNELFEFSALPVAG